MSILLTIPVSADQEDAIFSHVFEGKELGMVTDEKAWMLAHARKAHPGCKILGADLNIATLEWDLTIDEK
ncbi:hypothetical protein [Acinetobacter sp.]|uniref:hypothetical protein n=1 Tax=Acinetobacter sp. TaxID=472 RepID=UPI0038908241